MKIIVGLGNPGPRYETTRHNAGFLVLDRLVEEWKAEGPVEQREAEIWRATVGGEKLLLVKPLTFMNRSGLAVAALYRFHKCRPDDLIVIHDDVDLKPFLLRIKVGGGTGGHNGLRSIDSQLGSEHTGYHRIRIGIGRPPSLDEATAVPTSISMESWVLQPFGDAELQALGATIEKAVRAAGAIVLEGAAKAMNEFNRSE